MSSGARLILRAAAGSLVIAALWIVLASITPTTNYHLAPMVAVIAAPSTIRLTVPGRPAPVVAVSAVAIGIIVATGSALLIHAAGWDLGHAISTSITTRSETVVVIALGAVIGAVIAALPSKDDARSPG
ncbi:hypothetical protein [Demequina aurantiaca]|uniref:hypothetical protein n=1 Tax=Demequina aurantiaca TaxID=676200 RepID=UPI003D32A701